MPLAGDMRTDPTVSGDPESRHRRDADGGNRGNALFYNVLAGILVNYPEMQSVGFAPPIRLEEKRLFYNGFEGLQVMLRMSLLF